MDSSESISFSMDTTTDSIDVLGHFKPETKQTQMQHQQHNNRSNSNLQQQKQKKPLVFKSQNNHNNAQPKNILTDAIKLGGFYDKDAITCKLPPDKLCLNINDETPPSTSSIEAKSDFVKARHLSQQSSNHQCQASSSSAASVSSLSNFISSYSENKQMPAQKTTSCPTTETKKSVLFDKVTVYHFNRSQGFTSVPTQGGSTLGMKRKHFLRRRLSVDLYEEVRRRSRRQILLKIHIEKRKRDERLLQQQKLKQQDNRLKSSEPDASRMSSPDSEENGGDQGGERKFTPSSSYDNRNGTDDKNNDTVKNLDDTRRDKKVIVVDDCATDQEDDDEDDESYSDYSDISDSELESDSYIFLQPIGVKLRRSLLRASGVGRIDPVEKKDCKKIRDSRERSGCRCVGQCIPEFCECSRLGVKCHVDRVSFPCGCDSEGCKNPEGRSEFDISRVREHFMEKLIESHNQLSSNEEELTTTTPTNSTTSEESC